MHPLSGAHEQGNHRCCQVTHLLDEFQGQQRVPRHRKKPIQFPVCQGHFDFGRIQTLGLHWLRQAKTNSGTHEHGKFITRLWQTDFEVIRSSRPKRNHLYREDFHKGPNCCKSVQKEQILQHGRGESSETSICSLACSIIDHQTRIDSGCILNATYDAKSEKQRPKKECTSQASDSADCAKRTNLESDARLHND